MDLPCGNTKFYLLNFLVSKWDQLAQLWMRSRSLYQFLVLDTPLHKGIQLFGEVLERRYLCQTNLTKVEYIYHPLNACERRWRVTLRLAA